MSDPIGALGYRAMQGIQGPQGPGGDARKGITLDAGINDGPSFGDQLKRMLGEVSTAQETAQDYMGKFVRGEPVELHQVMAASEEAGIALEMLVEVRNKLIDAYRTVSSMQS
jgi:flagellar hook-basal body complex protein FliE